MSKYEKNIFFVFLKKRGKKYFLLEIFFTGHLPRKTTYGRRPGKKFDFPALPWCLCYLNITFTFTPLSSNCSIYHCCNPWIIINHHLWQRYLLSCAFGQLKILHVFLESSSSSVMLSDRNDWLILSFYFYFICHDMITSLVY